MAVVAVAVLLALRWPEAMRRVSRGLAGVAGVALLGVIATGWIHHPRIVVVTHKWSAHGLFILYWNAAPLAIGLTLIRGRSHPLSTVVRVVMFLFLLGVLLAASLTGYLVRPPVRPMR